MFFRPFWPFGRRCCRNTCCGGSGSAPYQWSCTCSRVADVPMKVVHGDGTTIPELWEETNEILAENTAILADISRTLKRNSCR